MVFDDLDANAVHVVIYIDIPETENKLIVAAGRMTYDGENCIIDNISVRKEYRGKRYGDLTVRMLLNKAFQSGIKIITLKTEVQNCEFFKKIGFQYEGKVFEESKISFCKMIIHKEEFTTLCEKYRKI
jgi:N-acetylglutamate synthase-like GNAT family acetyltransferase